MKTKGIISFFTRAADAKVAVEPVPVVAIENQTIVDLTTTGDSQKRKSVLLTDTEEIVTLEPPSKDTRKGKEVSLTSFKSWGYDFIGYRSEMVNGVEKVFIKFSTLKLFSKIDVKLCRLLFTIYKHIHLFIRTRSL